MKKKFLIYLWRRFFKKVLVTCDTVIEVIKRNQECLLSLQWSKFLFPVVIMEKQLIGENGTYVGLGL